MLGHGTRIFVWITTLCSHRPLSCQTKICNTQHTISSHQQIAWLQITMNDTVCVYILNTPD